MVRWWDKSLDVGGRCLEMGCERSSEGVWVNIRFVVVLLGTSWPSWERYFFDLRSLSVGGWLVEKYAEIVTLLPKRESLRDAFLLRLACQRRFVSG